jgi:hypothetical protein
LSIHISYALTFSGQNWVDEWSQLCASPELSFDRDYLVPLPRADGETFKRAPAEYVDALGFSRQVLSSLRVPTYDETRGCFVESLEDLLGANVAGFWSEHSERRFLNGKAAEAGIEKSRRDFLGRWLPNQSDNYLQTARATVWAVQEEVRDVIWNHPRRVDESETFRHLEVYMRQNRCGSDEVDQQLARLKLPANFLDKQPSTSLPAAGAMIAGTVEPLPEALGVHAASADAGSEEDGDRVSAAKLADSTQAKYIISYTRRRKCATLHKAVGGCHRRPGYELRDCIGIAQLEDKDDARLCGDCWPKHASAPEPLENSDASASGDSSSSSSGS